MTVYPQFPVVVRGVVLSLQGIRQQANEFAPVPGKAPQLYAVRCGGHGACSSGQSVHLQRHLPGNGQQRFRQAVCLIEYIHPICCHQSSLSPFLRGKAKSPELADQTEQKALRGKTQHLPRLIQPVNGLPFPLFKGLQCLLTGQSYFGHMLVHSLSRRNRRHIGSQSRLLPQASHGQQQAGNGKEGLFLPEGLRQTGAIGNISQGSQKPVRVLTHFGLPGTGAFPQQGMPSQSRLYFPAALLAFGQCAQGRQSLCGFRAR